MFNVFAKGIVVGVWALPLQVCPYIRGLFRSFGAPLPVRGYQVSGFRFSSGTCSGG